MEPYVSARDLTKTYGQAAPAVDRVSFTLERGEMLALLGPSGCGKTTILRMIAGLIAPTSGSILLDGREIAALPVHKRNMGMVFQSYALLPHLSVAGNVGFGLEMRGVRRAERRKRVQAALDLVKLGDKGARRPSQLSGGQQQRAALARSLVIEPSLLLLDEPLSNLDAKLRDELRGEIRDLQRRTGTTAIFVTHDQAEALAAADRIAVMSAGRIEQIGAPADIFDRPATRFVAGFIGGGTFFDGILRARLAGSTLVDIAGLGLVEVAAATAAAATAMPLSASVTLMLRPHRIDLLAANRAAAAKGTAAANRAAAADAAAGATAATEAINRFAGRIETAVYTGELVASTVRVGAHLIAVNTFARGAPLAPGDAVTLTWRPEDVIVISATQP